jgi:hypothetical protein
MFYYVTINGQYVVSPSYGKLALSAEPTYFWETEQQAKDDTLLKKLISQSSGEVKYVRTYRS